MTANPAAGRKAAPVELKLLKSPRADKREDAAGRPIPEPLPYVRQPPEKPSELSSDASWLWDRVVDQMCRVGLLKPLDGAALEIMCETYARWREAKRMRQQVSKPLVERDDWDPENGPLPMSEGGLLATNSQGRVTAPWIGIEERAAKDFRSWCAEFGITPAAEKNLVADAPEANPGIGGGINGNPY